MIYVFNNNKYNIKSITEIYINFLIKNKKYLLKLRKTLLNFFLYYVQKSHFISLFWLVLVTFIALVIKVITFYTLSQIMSTFIYQATITFEY